MISLINRPLHLSIAVASDEPGFALELRLIKAALLYADQATVFNFQHAVFGPMILRAQQNTDRTPFSSIVLKSLAEGSTGKGISPSLLLHQIQEINRAMNSGYVHEGYSDPASELVSWLIELINYITESRGEKNVPDSSALPTGSVQADGPELPEAFRNSSKLLFRSLADGTTYPLLDRQHVQQWARYVAELQADNTTEVAAPDHAETIFKAKEVSLAIDLFARLPTFTTASIDEILDIRRELNNPLTHFRSGIIKLAEQITSEPWDKDFEHEAERLVRRDIEPTILHLEEDIRSNKLLTKLAYKGFKDPIEVSGATGLGFVLGSLGGAATSIVGAIAGVGVAALDVYREWKDKKRELERNQVYFIYEAGQRLNRQHRKRQRR